MLAHPLVFSSLYIMNKRHSVDHVIKFKMASQKRVSDYFQQVSQSPHLKGHLIQLILLIQVMGLMMKKTLQRL